MNSFGFIITRHVNSEKTNLYWNHSIKLLRTFYPYVKIVIIDDNSNQNYIKSDFDYKNIEVIQSEFPGRGELLPYYYYIKNKFFENAIIIHDSVFFHKRIMFEKLNGIDVLPLWHFDSDKDNIIDTIKILQNLKNKQLLDKKISNNFSIDLLTDKWYGCFGVQSYINHNFLLKIEEKYKITNLLPCILCRSDRCCLERILGCIFSIEKSKINKSPSLFGNIRKHQNWGYTFDEYLYNLKKGTVKRYTVKIWTGR
jgi:hypothetical protein